MLSAIFASGSIIFATSRAEERVCTANEIAALTARGKFCPKPRSLTHDDTRFAANIRSIKK
jgi:hypothetical protein